jgi:hypothetical protein
MARHRLFGFNLIRSNAKICGFNLTGMLDHAMTGQGLWRFWRDTRRLRRCLRRLGACTMVPVRGAWAYLPGKACHTRGRVGQ